MQALMMTGVKNVLFGIHRQNLWFSGDLVDLTSNHMFCSFAGFETLCLL